ncbi:MAG: pacearchaeosortase [Nanoarchaeota archaeon]
MNKIHKKFVDIFARYSVLLAVLFPSLWIFYFVLTPLTVYPVFHILGIFFDTILIKNTIIINNQIPIDLIRACIAGSAYYLLMILNLSIPGINFKKRIKMIFISFAILLFVNILRIVGLSFIFLGDFRFFVEAHQFLWYFMSTIFVVAIWFSEVKFFKIKEIPFYSDLKFLHKHSFLK